MEIHTSYRDLSSRTARFCLLGIAGATFGALSLVFELSSPGPATAQEARTETPFQFPWLHTPAAYESPRIGDIPAPEGFTRTPVEPASWAAYLRALPLSADSVVHLYDGRPKENQQAHYRILEIDVGVQDLQQCADAVIRLRAEYLYEQDRYAHIAFNVSSGDRARFDEWIEGYRPRVRGNRITWRHRAEPDASYNNFKNYLKTVYTYAGTWSLDHELQPIDLSNLAIGDVFIQGGHPGHAVLVVDTAIHAESGRTAFLLAQSFMPAQEIHVLRNPSGPPDPSGSIAKGPWYIAGATEQLVTPEWTFAWSDLKRFR